MSNPLPKPPLKKVVDPIKKGPAGGPNTPGEKSKRAAQTTDKANA